MSADGARRFRRDQRLLDSRDFTRILRAGRRRSCEELAVVVTERRRVVRRSPERATTGAAERSGPIGGSRLGITVGRKAGSAVERNRFKRRVREWFRHHHEELVGPIDVVVIARRSGVELDSPALADRLAKLIRTDPVKRRNEKESSN